ncbi:hypothetical protein CANCADRAFT_90717 [Tortispora caseinolytica NRRL Y-17796]|uniref:Pal1-domain-containing protein n=1 Tax=Tortispora caseinolytica NRRL Y-17796 TaxID=767744 RepID=A0A1E4TLS3_9ASCO|nr:hypothetical protein CANCADRAFT_90717 [Tortispora caseinolytica NRRL Y-17796]
MTTHERFASRNPFRESIGDSSAGIAYSRNSSQDSRGSGSHNPFIDMKPVQPPPMMRSLSESSSVGKKMSRLSLSDKPSPRKPARPQGAKNSTKTESLQRGTAKDDRKEHPSSKDKKKKKGTKNVPVDRIDRLDVTGYFGIGSFHHDGPFDACTPHRNKNKERAPVLAFPADSVNMSLAASLAGPTDSDSQNQLFGTNEPEAYFDYNNSASRKLNSSKLGRAKSVHTSRPTSTSWAKASEPVQIDPAAKAEFVHGDESLGLGSSTFLEGAPAPSSLAARNVSPSNGNGLGRKKSLVKRFRSLSRKESSASRERSLSKTQSNEQFAVTPTNSDTAVPPPPSSKNEEGVGIIKRVKSLRGRKQ